MTVGLLLRLNWKIRLPIKPLLRKLSYSTEACDFNYEEVYRNFKWDVPKYFNFAQDVIDKFATDPAKKDVLSFFHVSENNKVKKWTYEDLMNESIYCSSALKSLGKLERVIVVLPRVPEWWVLNLAAIRIGAILLPGPTLLTPLDLHHRLLKSESDCFISDLKTAKKLEDEVLSKNNSSYPKLRVKIVVENPDSDDPEVLKALINERNWISLNKLIEEKGSLDLERVVTKSDDIMQIYFTSGTTGHPKMVPHTHASYGYCLWPTGKYWLNLKEGEVHWNISDTGWAKSAWSNVFAPWSQCATVFVHGMSRFLAKEVLKVLAEYPISSLCAPPTLYRSLILEDFPERLNPSLRHCVSAGEPLNEEVITFWKEKTGMLIREGYGQTETTLLAGYFPGIEVRPGSMGKAAPGVDLRIVNNMGIEVSRGEQGNIGIYRKPPHTPPNIFKGYIKDTELTNYSITGDYYLTGDRASIDEDGYIWFASRIDDLIISSGYRIGPFEVESALLAHPSVAESAVVASPDVARGQVVKAFIVLTKEYQSKLNEGSPEFKDDLISELQNFVKKTTAPYKYPRKIEFVESLPKTISGKIRRAQLRLKEEELSVQMEP